jgi:hypothetical protein
MTLYSKLFTFSLREDANAPVQEQQPQMPAPPPGPQPDTDGLISPYTLPRKDITALAIDELESQSRMLGFNISTVYAKCAPSINLVKRIDTSGYTEFKSRIIDTMDLNNILTDNETIKDHLADIFTWAYAKCEGPDLFLVYSNKRTVEQTARAIFSVASKAGLRIPAGKIKNLLINVLEKVLQKPEKTSSNGPN